MRQYSAIALAVSSAMLFAACSSTKLDDKPKIDDKPVQTAPVQQGDTRTVTPITTAPEPAVPADASRSVYFDFDSYAVKSDYNTLVTNHANYLSKHQSRKIQIQGNTDERGTAEYNLALGQKRAEAVRKALVALGVSDGQMEATSNGKTKPKAEGHDESAWKENRRADIMYAGK